MYYCLNIVTERKNFPAAVLIRGVAIKGGEDIVLDGPGKLCQFFKIDRKLNGWDLVKEEKLWIKKGIKIKKPQIKKSKRVGVDYAGKCRHYLRRFCLE